MKPFLIIVLASACFVTAVFGSEVPFHDDFKGKLDPGWSWVREHPGAWRVTTHGLEVLIEPGNMWGPQNNARNLLLREAPMQQMPKLKVPAASKNSRPINMNKLTLSGITTTATWSNRVRSRSVAN